MGIMLSVCVVVGRVVSVGVVSVDITRFVSAQ